MAFPWLMTGGGPPNKGRPQPIEQRRKQSATKKAMLARGWHPANWGRKMAYTAEHLEKLRANLARAVAARRKYTDGDVADCSSNGYTLVYTPGHPHANSAGYAHEHRLIAERTLGRPLERREIVHHINGNKADNRNCNLLICDASYHHWLHNRMAALFQEAAFGGR